MKFDMPDTSKMTIEEKVDASLSASTQLHDCLEDHREETRIAFKVIGDKLGELSVAQSINNGVTVGLAKRMGLNLDVKEDGEVHGIEKVKAAVGAWSMKKTLAVMGSWGTLVLVLIAIVGPPFVNFLRECWDRLLAYVFH